ncbi:MAG: hypothetical protein Q7S48_01315 [bacterium]|nr:hypothetical protein [bacterium]
MRHAWKLIMAGILAILCLNLGGSNHPPNNNAVSSLEVDEATNIAKADATAVKEDGEDISSANNVYGITSNTAKAKATANKNEYAIDIWFNKRQITLFMNDDDSGVTRSVTGSSPAETVETTLYSNNADDAAKILSLHADAEPAEVALRVIQGQRLNC